MITLCLLFVGFVLGFVTSEVLDVMSDLRRWDAHVGDALDVSGPEDRDDW